MNIVALSGGKASAYCAKWALETFPRDEVTLYFNDTKWEHQDLYRFLSDLECYLDKPITNDSNGLSVEELFYKEHSLADNRRPFCSRILKGERLQKYYNDGDTLIFGISYEEKERATRLLQVYQLVATKTGKYPTLRFPLIENKVGKQQVNQFLSDAKIEQPILYKMGFLHNNCSGGCVRAGKKHWKLLLDKLPEVYAERERVEEEFRQHFNKDVHFLKDVTLKKLRQDCEMQIPMIFDTDDTDTVECIGICNSMS